MRLFGLVFSAIFFLVSIASADMAIFTTPQDFDQGNARGLNISNSAGGELVLTVKGVPTGVTIAASFLPTSLQNFGLVKYGSSIYIFGGSTGSNSRNQILKANIDSSTGNLGSFDTLAYSLPYTNGVNSLEVVNIGKYIYLIGGESNGLLQNKVYRLTLDGSGNIAACDPQADFPVGITKHQAVVYGGRVFVIGGYDGATPRSDIWYANVQPNGQITAWTAVNSAQRLPKGLQKHAVAMIQNRLFVIGGNSGSPESLIYYSDVAVDLSLSTWQTATSSSLPLALEGHQACFSGGYLVVSGGLSSGVAQRYMLMNLADASNNLSASWEQVPSALNIPVSGHRMVDDQDKLYILGGSSQSEVYFFSEKSRRPHRPFRPAACFRSTLSVG